MSGSVTEVLPTVVVSYNKIDMDRVGCVLNWTINLTNGISIFCSVAVFV